MSNKLKFVISFPDFKEKGELFNLYKGFVRCINCDDAFVLLINSTTTGLKSESIINSIVYNIQKLTEVQIEKFFSNSYSVIQKLDWRRKSRAAKLLFRSSPYLCKRDVSKLIKYFLNSKHTLFRSYGYEILENQKLNFTKELLKTWNRYNDIEALEHLINYLNPKELFALFNEADEVFSEAEFDFDVLKLRNLYYSKIIDFIPGKLSELLAKDPVSYVFVMKNANLKIEKDLALRIYRENNTSRSLAACYGDLGQWDVLIEIYKYITKNVKNAR